MVQRHGPSPPEKSKNQNPFFWFSSRLPKPSIKKLGKEKKVRITSNYFFTAFPKFVFLPFSVIDSAWPI